MSGNRKIISFAWTTDALLTGRKRVTRRRWKDSYARRFKAGDLVEAYDRLPRFGGKRVATIRLTCDPYKERLADMPPEDLEAEGGLWKSKEDFVRALGGDPDETVWVVRFELVEVDLDAVFERIERERAARIKAEIEAAWAEREKQRRESFDMEPETFAVVPAMIPVQR